MSAIIDTGLNWVPTVGRVDPDLFAHLVRARIRDERSYLEREHLLTRRVRGLTAQTRRDLLLLDRIPLTDLVRVSPPWLLEMSLEVMGVPFGICEKLKRGRVRDLSGPLAGSLSAEEVGTVRLALYRAGKSGAPSRVSPPPPPGDRVMTLLVSASATVLDLPVAEIPGLPRRVRNALRSGSIDQVSNLSGWSDTALQFLPQFGQKSLDDLLACLQAVMEANPSDEALDSREPEPCP